MAVAELPWAEQINSVFGGTNYRLLTGAGFERFAHCPTMDGKLILIILSTIDTNLFDRFAKCTLQVAIRP